MGDVLASSSALRLLPDFGEFIAVRLGPEALTGGLPARAFPIGLVARLPKGLFPRLMLFVFGFGAFGLVARLATTECPPRLGDAVGDAARDPVTVCPVREGLVCDCGVWGFICGA